MIKHQLPTDHKEAETDVQTHGVETVEGDGGGGGSGGGVGLGEAEEHRGVGGEAAGGEEEGGGSPYRLRRTRSMITARTYDYVGEKTCDANAKIFEDCIQAGV